MRIRDNQDRSERCINNELKLINDLFAGKIGESIKGDIQLNALTCHRDGFSIKSGANTRS